MCIPLDISQSVHKYFVRYELFSVLLLYHSHSNIYETHFILSYMKVYYPREILCISDTAHSSRCRFLSWFDKKTVPTGRLAKLL